MKQIFKQFLKDNWDEMVEIAEKSTGESYTGREPLLTKDTIIDLAKDLWTDEQNNDICIQCGETRGAIKKNKLFCYTMSHTESGSEADQEFDRHRFKPYSHRRKPKNIWIKK